MSLRARVALAAALSTVIVVVAAGLGLLVLVRRDERDRLDDQLERQAEQIARPGTLALVLRERRFERAPPRPDLLVLARIRDGGETLLVSEDFPVLPAETDVGFSSESVDGERWRVLTTLVARPRREVGDPLAVQVTVSMAGVDETVAELRRLLLLVGAVAVGAAALGGWLLGSVAIRPLLRLRGEAERVSDTADLSLRVPTDQGPREVDELGASLNAMLGRIEEGSDRTRAALTASREFAANIAHELRTPLTSMRTNLDVLTENPDLPPAERVAIAREIAEQQSRLVDAIEALRLLARGELAAEDAFEEIEAADFVDGLVAQARGRYPDVTIGFEARTDPLPVRAWPEGVRVLLDNLLANAVTHGRPAEGPAEIGVLLDADDEEWRTEVSDRGPGIPPAERERVFERFARGSGSTTSGSGLGLALVAQQAELHGGRVEVGERPGGGARITVRLLRTAGQPT